MILFDLRCAKGHVFEAWFRDGGTAERQLAAHKLACPDCGSAKVTKAPMAPRIGKGSKAADRPQGNAGDKAEGSNPPPQGALAGPAALVAKQLRELRAKVEANFDYVGERFAEEARKIHYGETDARGIYGETSDDEAQSLSEEGVEFARIPWLPRHDS
jgi:hypothetical protein